MKTATLAKVANSEQELVAKGHAVIRTLKTGWLELCSIMLELQNLNPTWTQERLGQEFGLSQQSVSSGLVTIQDERIYLRVSKNPDSLPTSRFLQYQLTTIKGPDFDRYCRPDVTREEIAEYKRRLTAPISDTRNESKPSPRPPCPGVEGIGPGLWKWSEGMEEWVQQTPYKEEPVRVRLKDLPEGGSPTEQDYLNSPYLKDRNANNEGAEVAKNFNTIEAWAEKYPHVSSISKEHACQALGIAYPARKEVLECVYKMYASKHHPDRGGQASVMAFINLCKGALNE